MRRFTKLFVGAGVGSVDGVIEEDSVLPAHYTIRVVMPDNYMVDAKVESSPANSHAMGVRQHSTAGCALLCLSSTTSMSLSGSRAGRFRKISSLWRRTTTCLAERRAPNFRCSRSALLTFFFRTRRMHHDALRSPSTIGCPSTTRLACCLHP